MSCDCSIAVGSTFYQEFDTIYPSGPNKGQLVDADALPTVEIWLDGEVQSTPVAVVEHPDVGKYSITFVIPDTWNVGQNCNVYVNIVLFGTHYRNVVATISVANPNIPNPPYTPVVSRQAIEIMFGAINVARWADADNDNDPTKIAARIAWAANEARMYVEGRLALKFSVPFNPLPALLVGVIVERAGVELYRSPRGLVDGEDSYKAMMDHKKNVEVRISQILAGTLQLIDAVCDVTTVPMAIPNEPINTLDLSPFRPVINPYLQMYGFPSDAMFYQT